MLTKPINIHSKPSELTFAKGKYHILFWVVGTLMTWYLMFELRIYLIWLMLQLQNGKYNHLKPEKEQNVTMNSKLLNQINMN